MRNFLPQIDYSQPMPAPAKKEKQEESLEQRVERLERIILILESELMKKVPFADAQELLELYAELEVQSETEPRTG